MPPRGRRGILLPARRNPRRIGHGRARMHVPEPATTAQRRFLGILEEEAKAIHANTGRRPSGRLAFVSDLRLARRHLMQGHLFKKYPERIEEQWQQLHRPELIKLYPGGTVERPLHLLFIGSNASEQLMRSVARYLIAPDICPLLTRNVLIAVGADQRAKQERRASIRAAETARGRRN